MNETFLANSPVLWQEFKKVIDCSHSVLLVSHIRPDGDAIGSQIAFSNILEQYGKNVIIVNADPVPPSLTFLDPDQKILHLDQLTKDQQERMNSVDLVASLDTSSWAQLGKMGDFFKTSSANKIVLDHHVQGDDLGATMFIDSSAEAAGTLVFQASKILNVPLSFSIAFPLFAAIATDTGWFRFHSATSQTYRMTAELIDSGVRPDDVYKLIYEQESLGRIRLTGFALQKTQPFLNQKGLWTSLTLDDFERANALPFDSEDIVNKLLQVAGTEVAVIMVEQKTGGFKLSFRSRCELDCSRLAKRFGGGGHKKAAGAFLNDCYENVQKAILSATKDEYERL
ncbi:MAG: bifunctional oligoribonuclease/PAP phosphatase NrnA [Planctomycetia bacterium]|nr:bifunctional oligoribonuclease/PAP phosphatase NrnA [Planctomycetia bacterium]